MLGGPAACHRLLLLHAAAGGQRSQLHHLGLVLGVELWAQDFRDRPVQLQLEVQRKQRQQQQRAGLQGEGLQEGRQEGLSSAAGMQGDGEDLSGGRASAAAAVLRQDLVLPEGQHKVDCAPEGENCRPTGPSTSSEGGPAAEAPGECLALIEAIRREEFGLGGDEEALGEAGRRLREVTGKRPCDTVPAPTPVSISELPSPPLPYTPESPPPRTPHVPFRFRMRGCASTPPHLLSTSSPHTHNTSGPERADGARSAAAQP